MAVLEVKGLLNHFETRAEETPALMAIRTIEAADGAIHVSLHDPSEPPLHPITSEVKVSCLLFR